MNTFLLFLTIVAWPIAVVCNLLFVIFMLASVFSSTYRETHVNAVISGRMFMYAVIPTAWLITYYLSWTPFI